MTHFKSLLYFFILAISLSACSPKYYTPDSHNIPLISRKGETNLAISGSTGRAEFQVSHGITDKIALKANGGAYFPSDFGRFETGNTGSGKFFEFGAGYFKPLENNWVFETYGILGMGSMEVDFSDTDVFDIDIDADGKLSAKILRFGVQPNIGYKTENFVFGAAARFVHLSFNDIEGDLVYLQTSQKDYLRRNNAHFLAEPGILIGMAFDKFSIRTHGGLSLNITDFKFQQYKSSITFIANFCF